MFLTCIRTGCMHLWILLLKTQYDLEFTHHVHFQQGFNRRDFLVLFQDSSSLNLMKTLKETFRRESIFPESLFGVGVGGYTVVP